MNNNLRKRERDKMEINLKDPDKWYKYYSRIKDEEGHEKKFEYIMETLKCDVPDRFFDETDMEGCIYSIMEILQKDKQYDRMLEVYQYAEKYRDKCEDAYFMDYYCIDYYLYKEDIEGIKKHLTGFLKDPVKSIDIFIPVFDKIIYYGYRDLSLEVSLSIADKIKDAPGLIPGAETDFYKVINSEKLQSIYNDVKNNIPIDRNAIVDYFNRYDYMVLKKDIIRLKRLWSSKKPYLPDFQAYIDDGENFEWDIMLLFMSYMGNKKALFTVARDIWYLATLSFEIDISGNEKAKNFDSLFKLDAKRYDNEISGRMDVLFSNKYTYSYAAAWGMVYVYDFLYINGYISEKIHDDALYEIDHLKVEIIKANANELWKYNFINKWEKPDYIPEDDFNNEKELFENSFSSIIEVVDSDTFDRIVSEE